MTRAGTLIGNSRINRKDAIDYLEGKGNLEDLLNEAWYFREKYFGRKVFLHVLQNAKSDKCPEDCHFCSQSSSYDSGIDVYPMVSVDEIYDQARESAKLGAAKHCIVTATRAPGSQIINTVCDAARRIKQDFNIEICASLGFLDEEKARKLKESGVDRYNHNLESSENFFPNIVSTHTWQDRFDTVKRVREAGMEICSGGIMGMGEGPEDRADLFFSLAELGVESVPVNFLNPRKGTPHENKNELHADDALRILAVARLVLPKADIRMAGGREQVLGEKDREGLRVANSMFVNGYLTSGGAGEVRDLRMIREEGFLPCLS